MMALLLLPSSDSCVRPESLAFTIKESRMYKVGQQVVCVNDAFDPLQCATIPNRPQRDKVYTVRDAFQVTRNGTSSGIWALHLTEISNPHLSHPSGLGTFEPSFAATRFAERREEIDTAAVEELLQGIEEAETVELV